VSSEREAGERRLEGPAKPEPPPSGTRKRVTRKGPGPRALRARAILIRVLEIAALAAGLLATAVVSAAITFTLAVRGNEVLVPDLAGASVEGAGESLRREELQLVVEGSRFHASVPPDFISEQIPARGTTLKKGRSVRVWVSLGPQKHTVPRIEGETLQSAQLILEQNGFSLGRVVEIHSEVYAPDTVVAQSPQAYEDVAETTEVAVLLSRGYLDNAYVMPDFIGRNYVEILDQISRGQVKISQVRLVDYPGVPKNVVVRQLPAPGVKVFKRDRIVLFLSKGA
jgi:eukaryotic-like serine/threonine-protein kinase